MRKYYLKIPGNKMLIKSEQFTASVLLKNLASVTLEGIIDFEHVLLNPYNVKCLYSTV
jgi:hypothetical protein